MYQHGSACYESAAIVNQLTAASEVGRVVQINGKTYVISVAGVTDSGITYDYLPASGGQQIQQLVPSIPPQCALLTLQDGIQIGWAIVGVWLAVYAITFITSYVKSELEGIKNDT